MIKSHPLPLYFDTAASTQVMPEVVAAMGDTLTVWHSQANPSSQEHIPGRAAAHSIASARARIANEFHCCTDEVIFTSGATESINLAIRGVATANRKQGCHILTSAIEHPATLSCCAALERTGFEVTYLPPCSEGRIDPQAVAAAIRSDTLLISLIHINNETGVIQPIEEIAAIAAEQGVLLHLDAAQSAGKFAIDLQQLPVDLLSLSAHKFHGPKGIGALIIRNRSQLPITPLLQGGGQEYGLRSGTVAPHQIEGLATALELTAQHRQAHHRSVIASRNRLLDKLAQLPFQINGALSHLSPYILNLSIAGVSSDALINQTAHEIAIASGSACSSGTLEPSRVLRAMGIEGERLYAAVRISFDPNHRERDIDHAAAAILNAVERIRALDSIT